MENLGFYGILHLLLHARFDFLFRFVSLILDRFFGFLWYPSPFASWPIQLSLPLRISDSRSIFCHSCIKLQWLLPLILLLHMNLFKIHPQIICQTLICRIRMLFLTIQNIRSMVLIKLERSNFFPWCALFALILRWYKLFSIVEGTESCTSLFIPDRSINPDFEIWY